jgi:hypothetical protein
MIKINEIVEKTLRKIEGIGIFYEEFGAFIDNDEFIIVYKNNGVYLAHISEFEQDGVLVKLKNG